MSKILVVVDLQNDFVEGGALAVEGGKAVAEKIGAVLESDHGYDYVIATQDWHIDPGPHWAEWDTEPNYVTSWPWHCGEDSWGSALVEAVTPHGHPADYFDTIVRKGQYGDGYSAFQGLTIDEKRTLADYLGEVAFRGTVDVVGIAYDHCVRATAIDAAFWGGRQGYNVRVIEPLTAAVDNSQENLDKLRAELTSAGVEVVLEYEV